jgi:hypothetical protein
MTFGAAPTVIVTVVAVAFVACCDDVIEPAASVLVYVPGVVAVTVAVTVQDAPAASVPPLIARFPPEIVAVALPHVVVAVVLANVTPAGSPYGASARAFSAAAPDPVFEIVKTNVPVALPANDGFEDVTVTFGADVSVTLAEVVCVFVYVAPPAVPVRLPDGI